MIQRQFGKTGLEISALAMGTVSLGVDYGIDAPGGFGRPGRDDSLALLRFAADAGIILFDTAPAYGDSESLVGEALGHRTECIIATKVSVPIVEAGATVSPAEVERQIRASLENSRRALRRDTLDIVQIHNATASLIHDGVLTDALRRAQADGWIRFIGASVYGIEAGQAAIVAGFDVIQVAYNVLDQRSADAVLAAAKRQGTGVIIRSAYLKGVLTDKAQFLPPSMQPLRDAATRVRDELAGRNWQQLAPAALRFCLSAPGHPAVLVGARTINELEVALAAVTRGPLADRDLALARDLGLADDALLNPSKWPIP